MLQQETLVPEMINLIKELQSNSLFDNYILAGCTALALQIGHRTSTDIDLFTFKEHNHISIIEYLKRTYKDIEVFIADENFIRVFINKIKVELVYYEEKNIEPIINEENIKLFNIFEIATMKLKAATGRTEARDFIDIAYLLKEMSLKNMFELYEKKFGMISPLYMKRTLLTKSKSIKHDEWLVGIKMLRDDIKPIDVPKYIEEKIEHYNREIGIGKK